MTLCMGNGKVRGILFDLDGTLLDSFPSHFEAYRVMFARYRIEISEESFLAAYSPNWYHTYEALGLPGEVWEEANSHWVEAAAALPPLPFPGAAETLEALGSSYELGVVTSGSRGRVLRDLERTGIGRFFRVVVTGDDVREPKPAPEGLELGLARMGLSPGEAVYVGDAHADYEMARAAGVEFLGIPSSFASLKGDHPCRKVLSITDLVEVFK
ncbi:MAG TPA: HAD family hydrolase [Pyrinomonadaceae bacterium]|nr:HAD family hydrolase [Pyrinomonadaceae bacterium]